jgi:hypothetical protein
MVHQNLCPLVNQRQHSSKIHSRIKSTLKITRHGDHEQPEIRDQELLETEDQEVKKRGIRIALKGGHEFYHIGYSKGENFQTEGKNGFNGSFDVPSSVCQKQKLSSVKQAVFQQESQHNFT